MVAALARRCRCRPASPSSRVAVHTADAHVRQPLLQDLQERPGVRRRGRKMRLGGADPARVGRVRPNGDPRVDQVVTMQLRCDQDEAVLVHAHAGDSVAEVGAEEPQDRLGVPCRGVELLVEGAAADAQLLHRSVVELVEQDADRLVQRTELEEGLVAEPGQYPPLGDEYAGLDESLRQSSNLHRVLLKHRRFASPIRSIRSGAPASRSW